MLSTTRRVYFYDQTRYFPPKKRIYILKMLNRIYPHDTIIHTGDVSRARIVIFPDELSRESIRKELRFPDAVFFSDWWFRNDRVYT